ncbi:unnamed protein product [Tuber aestivum]|uniref:DUF6589 domain-containing protein n=1 Tax=Tuber aestivum TaxID=59557 RepID=A0A292PNS4_9PEZI|nr:unnamed protein product [Tuber aestivum]
MPRRRKEPPPLAPQPQQLQPRQSPQYCIPVHRSPPPLPPSTLHVFTSGPIPLTPQQQQPHQQHQPQQPYRNHPQQQGAPLPPYSPGSLGAQSPEPLRLLAVLDSLKSLGFASISDFLVRLFSSDDSAVRRRVGLFYTHGGIRSVLEIFMNSKHARESGGDELSASWAGRVFKDEFDAGLVKCGINVDVRANSTESRGRTTGEILREGLENFDLAKVQRQCERKAPLLWRLLETLSSSDRERVEAGALAASAGDETAKQPLSKRRKTDMNPTIASWSVMGAPSNPPLTVTFMLLLLASSQVRNKFQKWLGLYLYAQGVRKGPLNSLRALGVGSEGKVIGDNGDDIKKKLRTEMGGSDLQVRGPGAPRINSRAAKRKSILIESRPVDIERPNLLEGKRPFVISQITYHPTPKDHLRADNFAPCATIPFIIRLPLSTPLLTRAMVKTSCTFRREKYLHNVSVTPASPVPPIPTLVSVRPAPGPTYPPASYSPYGVSQSAAFNTTPLVTAPPHLHHTAIIILRSSTLSTLPPLQGQLGPAAQRLPREQRWRNTSRLAVWRAMGRLWPKIGEILDESEVNTEQPCLAAFPRVPRVPREHESEIARGGQRASRICEDDLFPMPGMKRVSIKKLGEQMSILELITEYLGIKPEHMKGSGSVDRLWLWAGNLEFVLALRMAKSVALPDSILHNIHPVLQLFDIRQHFLFELLKQHYGRPNDKDPTSLCHHMQIMNRRFLIFGFSVTGQYAEGLLLHSLESHLIHSILTVTQVRESGPKTKKEALDIITRVYDTYLEPEAVKNYQSVSDPRTRDEVFENHMLLMQHSLVYLAFLEAISTASTTSLLHVLSWLSTAFQSPSFSISSSLGHELLDLVAGLTDEWEPPLRRAVLDSMLIPKTPGAPFPALASHPASPKISGGYQEVDFAMKQLLRQTKTVFDLRDNPKLDFFREVATPNIRTISKVVRNAEESLGTAPRTANQWKSPAENVDPDREIPKLVKELREARVGEWVPGRKAGFKISHLFCDGEERVRSPGFLEEFVKRGDGGTICGGSSGETDGDKECRRRNLFSAQDFEFDWGL